MTSESWRSVQRHTATIDDGLLVFVLGVCELDTEISSVVLGNERTSGVFGHSLQEGSEEFAIIDDARGGHRLLKFLFVQRGKSEDVRIVDLAQSKEKGVEGDGERENQKRGEATVLR